MHFTNTIGNGNLYIVKKMLLLVYNNSLDALLLKHYVKNSSNWLSISQFCALNT